MERDDHCNKSDYIVYCNVVMNSDEDNISNTTLLTLYFIFLSLNTLFDDGDGAALPVP